MRILVVYYSRTGNTAKVGKLVADRLSAEVEEIHEARSRRGMFEYLRSAYEALRKQLPEISPVSKNAEDYDLVILGCPVWAGNIAAPMRTYVSRYGGKIKRLALFCTEGGHGGTGVLQELGSICSREAVAQMVVTEGQLKSGEWSKLVDRFVADAKEGP